MWGANGEMLSKPITSCDAQDERQPFQRLLASQRGGVRMRVLWGGGGLGGALGGVKGVEAVAWMNCVREK